MWKVRHSAWLLAVILGVGSFSCVGFIYCAVRVRSTTWKRRAVVVTALSLVGLISLVTPVEPIQDLGAGYAAFLWLGLIGYGLFVNRDYLRWRSAQSPIAPPPAPWPPVVPVAAAPKPAATPTGPVPDRRGGSVPNGTAGRRGSPLPAQAVSSLVNEVPRFEAPPIEPGGRVVSSWQEAEALAAWHMRQLGFDDAEMTPPGADGGLDVRANDAVAQVKHYATPIGAPVVQQLRGAAHGRGAALFYSLTGYTKAAVEYANAAAVALFTYDEGGVVRPLNHAAQTLHDRAGGDDAFDAAEFEKQAQLAALLQQYFDVMNAKYIEVAKRALEAANGDNTSLIFRSAVAENARVAAILESLGVNGGPVSSDRIIDASSAIAQAAIRLAEDLERLYR
nr:restriction endonuclease [Nocardioides scoriae]